MLTYEDLIRIKSSMIFLTESCLHHVPLTLNLRLYLVTWMYVPHQLLEVSRMPHKLVLPNTGPTIRCIILPELSIIFGIHEVHEDLLTKGIHSLIKYVQNPNVNLIMIHFERDTSDHPTRCQYLGLISDMTTSWRWCVCCLGILRDILVAVCLAGSMEVKERWTDLPDRFLVNTAFNGYLIGDPLACIFVGFLVRMLMIALHNFLSIVALNSFYIFVTSPIPCPAIDTIHDH